MLSPMMINMLTVKNVPPAPATVSHQAEVALVAAAASCLITSGVFYTRKIFQIKSEFAEQILLHFIFCPTNFKLPGPSQGQELHNKIFVPSPVSLSWSWRGAALPGHRILVTRNPLSKVCTLLASATANKASVSWHPSCPA